MGHITILLFDLTGISLDYSDIMALVIAAIVSIAAVVKATSEIWRYGWKPASKKFWDWIRLRRSRKKMLEQFTNDMQTFSSTLRRIEAQVTTNGGSSLKDIVMSIDQKVDHAQARLHHLNETNPVPIFELDAFGHMRLTNSAFRDLLDGDDNDLQYKNYLSRAHPNDRQRLEGEIRQSIDNKMPIDSTALFLADGKYLKIRLQATPNLDNDANLLGYFGRATRIIET
jgi:PAS domain-containing protein